MLFMHVPANSALRHFSQLTGFRSAPKCKIREPKLFPKQLRLSETPIPTLFKFLFCGLRHQYHALNGITSFPQNFLLMTRLP